MRCDVSGNLTISAHSETHSSFVGLAVAKAAQKLRGPSKNLLKNSNGTWGVVGQGFSPDVSDGKTRRPSGPEACSSLQKLNLRG